MDYDGDGWLDVIMGGIGNSFLEDSIRLFHNDTTGMFSEILVDLPGYYPSDISIVDFDVDGDMDFFFTGGTLSVSTFPVTLLFSNEGNAQFAQVPFPFISLSTGTAAWADYDHDGDPDLLYDGLDSLIGLGVTLLYRNDSPDLFTRMETNLPGSGEPGSVDWADVDGDGDLDILLEVQLPCCEMTGTISILILHRMISRKVSRDHLLILTRMAIRTYSLLAPQVD
jgi:hypothetical protein